MQKNSDDLRNILFKSIDDVRNGKLTATDARAVAELSKQLIDSGRLDLEHAKAIEAKEINSVVLFHEKQQPAQIEQVEQGKQQQQAIPPKLVKELSKGAQEAVTDPDYEYVTSCYDDGMRPSAIAAELNADIKAVTKIINLHKAVTGAA